MNTTEIQDLIRRISREEGVSENYMLKVAAIESQLDPNATNPSSRAAGLFQILPMNNVKNVYDPEVNTRWTARFTSDNKAYLRRNNIPISEETLYLAHQQGRGGAVTIWKALQANKNIADMSPDIQRNMNSNNPRRYTNVRDWYEFWAKKMRSTPNPQNSTREQNQPIAVGGRGVQGNAPVGGQSTRGNQVPSSGVNIAQRDAETARIRAAQERQAREAQDRNAYAQSQGNRQAEGTSDDPNEAGASGLGTVLLVGAAGGLLWMLFGAGSQKQEQSSYNVKIVVEEEKETNMAEAA